MPCWFRFMIRIDTDKGWLLVEHPEHARLAGRFAARWGNDEFVAPEPRPEILFAVDHHDDAWAERDVPPHLTRDSRPSAFTRELVGKYSAFEEIDLADYLGVRGRATEAVAAAHPYAAIIISMHTVDLLTNQADLTRLSEADRALHKKFIDGQVRRQSELFVDLSSQRGYERSLEAASLREAFDFLQACDSLSLTSCVRYPSPIPLRGRHARRSGPAAELTCTPLGGDTYRISPYPFDSDDFTEEARCRHVAAGSFSDLASFRAAYAAAPVGVLPVRIVR